MRIAGTVSAGGQGHLAADSPEHRHCLTFGRRAGICYLAMEFVAGETLSTLINGQPIPAAEFVAIAWQLADALD